MEHHRISKNHANRCFHNWLAYDAGDLFLDRLSGYFSGVLIDLGCGEAPYREFFLNYADQYIGVDWAGSYHVTQADVVADLNEVLPFGCGIADTVVSTSVLEHLREPLVMLSEAHRILKPGGVIVLQVPWQWWIHEGPHDYFRYTPFGLRYLFEKAGFVDISVEPQSGFFSMWILKFNYFTLRIIRGPRPVRWIIRAALIPVWFVGQAVAPLLDKLDKDWALETLGFFVVAKKSAHQEGR